ncbi:MAG: potassium channel family protein [Thermodesulfobacteriota bacterium]
MHVAVIGLGNFGASLARRLTELGHHVSVVDADPKAVNRIADAAEQAVVADATDRLTLEEIGVNLMDAAVVSLGDNLGASIMATLHLKEMKIKRIVAKAISPDHEKILKRVGATDVVFPERDVALRLADTLSHPNLLDYLPLGHDFSVAELAPPPEFVGKTIMQLDLRRSHHLNVIAVRELVPERISVIIAPDYVVKDSDILVVVGRREDIEKLHKSRS